MRYHNTNRLIILIISLIVLFLVSFFSSNKGIRYFQLRKEQAQLENDLDELRQENNRLQKEVEQLKNDKGYFEEIARQKYGFLKKSEMVFDFNEKEAEKKEEKKEQ